jgi:hypothetical protein
MRRTDEDARPTPDAGTNGTAPHDGATEELERMVRALVGLARIEVLRVRHSLREALWHGCLFVWASLALAVATTVAATCIVIGVAGGFSEAFGGRTWAGMLAAGIGLFAAVYLVASLRRRQRSRERVAALLAGLGRTAPPQGGEGDSRRSEDAAL